VTEVKYTPHMSAVRTKGGRWRCPDCGFEADGPGQIVYVDGCTREYPPCKHCGQTPVCADDCPGIAKALAGDDVHLAGSMAPTEHES